MNDTLLIWSSGDDVMTKFVRLIDAMKGMKVNGKKPDKIIVPPNRVDHRGIRKLQKRLAHRGIVLDGNGVLLYPIKG